MNTYELIIRERGDTYCFAHPLRWVTVSFAPIFMEFKFITPVNHEIVSTPQPKLPVRPVSLLLTPSHVSVNMCGTNYQMVVDDAFPVEDKLKNVSYV